MRCDDVNKLFMVWFIHSILFAVCCVLHLPVLLVQGLKNLLLKVSCNLVPSFVFARHLLFTTMSRPSCTSQYHIFEDLLRNLSVQSRPFLEIPIL